MSEKKCVVSAEMRMIIDTIYPVGCYFWSSVNKDPATFLGGTWERLKDRFLLAAGDSYAAGSTGGEASHKLSVNEMPSHSHSASTNWTGNHNHAAYYHRTGEEAAGFGLAIVAGFDGFKDNILVSGRSTATSTAGSHSHTVTVNSTGGGAAHNNMPPYSAEYCWHRTA